MALIILAFSIVWDIIYGIYEDIKFRNRFSVRDNLAATYEGFVEGFKAGKNQLEYMWHS